MIRRCHNERSKDYRSYGRRGIRVCGEWHQFSAFREWAEGNGWAQGLSIDRIDNARGYEPSNCRWVPLEAQARNRSDNAWIEWRGRKIIMGEAARIAGLSRQTVHARLKRGWTTERALETPV